MQSNVDNLNLGVSKTKTLGPWTLKNEESNPNPST